MGCPLSKRIKFSRLAGLVCILEGIALHSADAAVWAHYEFEGNFLNSVDNVAANTSGFSTPGFTSGPATLGQAVSFIGSEGHEVWRNVQGQGLSFSSLTVAFWVRTSQANWRVPLTLEATTDHLITFQINGSGTPNLNDLDGMPGASNIATGGNPDALVSDGNWHHIAWTASQADNTSILYVNGVQVGSSSWSATTGVKLWMLGKEKGVDIRNYNGAIDDFRLYDFALTQSQIQDLIPVIPEPATVVLLAFGGLLFGRRWLNRGRGAS